MANSAPVAALQSEEARRKLEVQMAQEQAALRHNADAGSAAAMEELNASILALKARTHFPTARAMGEREHCHSFESWCAAAPVQLCFRPPGRRP